jgi:hypothetical protein
MLPRVRITDLLTEVAGWTGFLDCFTHLRTGETPADRQVLMAGLLAEGLNLGLTRMADTPALEPMIAGRINVALMRAHWSEILRVVTSIRTGAVTASLIMRQLAAHPRQNGVAAALREVGKLERTLLMLDWISTPALRRETGQELNKGEARNSLARAVFIHRLGEIRDRTYEDQQHRASGLNLVVTAIILWNTRYLERAVSALRQVEAVPDALLAHLSPLGWEHVNLTGDYVWAGQQDMSENPVGLRPLRQLPDTQPRAA